MKFPFSAYFILFLVFFGACKGLEKSAHKQSYNQTIVPIVLDDNEQRKFDYFFYEANREKMKGELQKSAMYLGECLKIDATSSAALYELANIFIAGNEPVKAQGLLERAVQINPDNIWYQILLADIYQNNKLTSLAIKSYENLVEANPSNIEFIYVLAQLYYTNEDYDKALTQYNILEKELGSNEIIILEKQKVLLQLGKNKQALSELEDLVDKNPNEPRYYAYIANYYMVNNDEVTATQYYKKVLALDASNGDANFNLGNMALSKNDTTSFMNHYSKALTNASIPFEVKFQRIIPFLVNDAKLLKSQPFLEQFFTDVVETHSTEPRALIYYGNYLKAINRSSEAITVFKNALSLDNTNEMLWQDYLLLLISTENFDLLYDDGSQALELFSENAFFYLITGSSALQLEKNEEAFTLFKTGLSHVVNNEALKAQFYANIGDTSYALEKPDDAFKYYDESLKIDPLSIVVLNNYSYYLSVENKDLARAEQMSSKCIELEPGNPTYLDTYAWVLFKRQRYFEARYIIERAMDNGGDKSDVIVEHYGDILFMNDDVSGALVQWNKSLQMGNSSVLLREKIKNKKYLD